MAKKSIKKYIADLKKQIKERTGSECESWLQSQLESAAMNQMMLSKIQEELMDENSLLVLGVGSNGQPTKNAHPLLPVYDKLQRTLTIQFESLGLNYKTTPSKVTENTKKGGGEQDRLLETLNAIK